MNIRKNLKVLVVDDIYLNRYVLMRTLRNKGFEVFEAENGKLALDIIKQQPIDVVFMDIEMPVMNGLETARSIKQLSHSSPKKIKIIALTAYNPSLIYDELNLSDFDGYVSKPFNEEKILQILDQI